MPTRRLRILVAIHAMLALAPLLMPLVPFSMTTAPLLWLLSSVTLAQIMLLAIWLGLTRGTLRAKLIGAIVATLYFSLWQVLANHLMAPNGSFVAAAGQYLTQTGMVLLFLAIIGGALKFSRRFLGCIQLESSGGSTCPASGSQYSLFALLVITTVAALLMGLAQHARVHKQETVSWASHAVMLLALLLNGLAAVWATLSQKLRKLHVALVFLVAILLGFTLSLATGNWDADLPIWFPLCVAMILVPPTAIVILTLLYVRRLGYRLCFSGKGEP